MNESNTASLRCYGDLNDFLPRALRGRVLQRAFADAPAVKDFVERCGVPHPEVALLLVNGRSAEFARPLANGDRVAVYPRFHRLDITADSRVVTVLAEPPRFVADVHLARTARLLRLLGFDTLHRADLGDETIAMLAHAEQRSVLTRDLALLKRSAVASGRYLRNTKPLLQAREVVAYFDLADHVRPFSRCTVCNGSVSPVSFDDVRDRVRPGVLERHRHFQRCELCGRVYWHGDHYRRLRQTVSWILSGP